MGEETHDRCKKCGHCLVKWCPCWDWPSNESLSDKLCPHCVDLGHGKTD